MTQKPIPLTIGTPEILRRAPAAPAEPRVVTQSEMAEWQRCKRKWWLSTYRQLRKKRYEGHAPLTIGSLVHKGLEAYYRPEGSVHPLDAIKALSMKMLEQYPDASEEILDCAELAGIMLEGYMDWLETEGGDVDYKVIGAEMPMDATLRKATATRPAVILRGKIDARLQRISDGMKVQLEDKTVGDLVQLPKTAQGNFQYLTYDLLAYLRSLEDEPDIRTDGVILNMLKKVKRTKAAHPPFYKRHEVRHNKEELRNHWRHVVAWVDEMDSARDRLDAGEDHHYVVPPTWKRDCAFDCQFYYVCSMLDDGSDAEGMLANAYEQHDPLERYEDDPE